MATIRVPGMASNAVIQARQGDVVMERAENCVISGTRVRIEHAVNCEIIGDEVRLGRAEGCAVAARRVIADAVAPAQAERDDGVRPAPRQRESWTR